MNGNSRPVQTIDWLDAAVLDGNDEDDDVGEDAAAAAAAATGDDGGGGGGVDEDDGYRNWQVCLGISITDLLAIQIAQSMNRVGHRGIHLICLIDF